MSKYMFRYLFILLFIPFILSGQDKTVDSLKLALKNAKHDTTRCNILNQLAEKASDDEWPLFNEQALKLAKKGLASSSSEASKIFYSNHIAGALNNFGFLAQQEGDYAKALKFYDETIKIFEEIGDKSSLGMSLSNIGAVYQALGDIPTAMKYYHKSLKIQETIGDKIGIAMALNQIGCIYKDQGDFPKALEYLSKSLKIQEEVGDKEGIANSLNNIASIYEIQGNIAKALEYFGKSLKIQEELGNKAGVASCLNYFGIIYQKQGDVKKALEYLSKSLKIREEIGDKNGTANSLNNIGFMYHSQGDLIKALEYWNKSLKLYEDIGNKSGIASALNNIGTAYINQGNMIKALEYLNKTLKVQEEIGDQQGIAISLNNIGKIYRTTGDIPQALTSFLKSLKIKEEMGDKQGIAYSLKNIGELYYIQKNYTKAIEYTNRSMLVSKEIGFPENIKNAAEILSNAYKATGNYKLTFENYELYIKMRDSLNNIETQKATIKQQTQYEYNKQKAIEDKEHELQLKQQAEKAKDEKIKQNIIILSVSLILIIVIIFSIFLYKRIKVTQQQKAVIELKEKETQLQKHIIEEKHKEITDSINYAERIQRSFLATKEILDTNLGDYFVLFKPKDVVSGDFYWASKLNNGRFALVTADSTGHGVPGAIMSLLNITSLEKAIETLIEPSEILNATRKTIIERLKKDGSEHGGKDGMDASLTVYDFANNKLVIAAANNPVWIVRRVTSSSDEGVLRQAQDKLNREVKTDNSSRYEQSSTRTDNFEVIEIKPDKMPVGKHDKDSISFTQHEMDLQKGDIVYTLTDGFPDQFGGEKGKKFMSKNLRELLAANAHLPMHEQKQLLEKTFSDWVGNLEQVDDVTVIGIKI